MSSDHPPPNVHLHLIHFKCSDFVFQNGVCPNFSGLEPCGRNDGEVAEPRCRSRPCPGGGPVLQDGPFTQRSHGVAAPGGIRESAQHNCGVELWRTYIHFSRYATVCAAEQRSGHADGGAWNMVRDPDMLLPK